MAPSARADRSAASVTGRSGGASRSTTASWESLSSRAFMRWEPRSSEGLGGIRPAGMTLRWGWPLTNWATSDTGTSPARTWVRPTEPSMSKMRWTTGLRRSVSTRMVRCPEAASICARTAEIVDLPSPGLAEVMTMARGGLSTSTKRRLVRSRRMASAAWPRPSTFLRPLALRSVERGTTARTEDWRMSSMSELWRILLSRARRRKATASPRASPPAPPMPASLVVSGEKGAPGSWAGSRATRRVWLL